MRKIHAILLLMALAACGQKTDLLPQAGDRLPVAPYGLEEQPSSSALLDLPPQAAPGRTVELRKRSEEREDDPFDLPPPE
ncbi:MAG: lipoprotein [Novosphingobium sp.]|nr:lipoprotein [Novosphingobium sp.]